METSVDQPAEAERDVSAATGERVGERFWDRLGRCVDDAGVAFESIAEVVVLVRQEPSGLV